MVVCVVYILAVVSSTNYTTWYCYVAGHKLLALQVVIANSSLLVAFGAPRFQLYASCVSHMTCIQLDNLRLLVRMYSFCLHLTLRPRIDFSVICNRTDNDNLRPIV